VIGKDRKYCAPRSVAYPLQLLDVVVDRYAQGAYRRRTYGAINEVAPAILLMSSGHLGDALILSYTFPLIRQRYPNARIDVLAGSWCDPIWNDNPYINRVVHLDHVSTNRRAVSRWQKWRTFGKSTRLAIQTLRDTVYDYSIDIRFSAAPMHFVLPYLNVKRKIGYGTRGFGGLLDDEFFMPEGETHNFELILQLLRPLGIDTELRAVKPYFYHPVQTPEQLWARLDQSVPTHKPILICPESGAPVRMLSLDFWADLCGKLLRDNPNPLVFVGQTPFTTQLAEQVKQAFPADTERLIPAVGKLRLGDIASLSEQALAAFTLDSLPTHLCCLGCPTVSFQKNGQGIQFFPIGSQPTLVLHNHKLSESLVLDRPGLQGAYVTDFDASVADDAIHWFRSTVEPTNVARQL